MRRAILIALLLLVSVLYLLQRNENWRLASKLGLLPVSEDFSPTVTTQPSSIPTNLISVLNVPPHMMRAAMQDAYRLRPDKRFLLAVAEVHHFLSGQEKLETTVEFQQNQWAIRYKATGVGVLPEFPDFPQTIKLLSDWVRAVQLEYPLCVSSEKVNQQAPIDPASSSTGTARCPERAGTAIQGKDISELERRLDRFLAPDIAAAARELNDRWLNGDRSPALLKAATRGLVLLSLQSLDRLETADLVPAKALALLVLTKGLTDENVNREETLLAELMGYSAHAQRVASTLPPLDPVRLFVMRDDGHLMKIAEGSDAAIEARYLWLLRLATLRDLEDFLSAVTSLFPSDWFSLPIFKVGLDLNKFGVNPTLSEALPLLVLLNLAQEVGMPSLKEILIRVQRKGFSDDELRTLLEAVQAILTAENSTIVNNFESGLPILDRYYKGPFLDSQTYQAYYRGFFFSALYTLGLHYLDSLSSETAASQFARSLGDTTVGTAADFQRWYRNLVASKSGKGDISRLIDDLTVLHNFGVPPLVRTFDEQERHFKYGDPLLLNAVKRLASRMDTRVQHRRELGRMAFANLYDLGLTERLYRSIVEADTSNQQDLQVWLAGWTHDQKQLDKLLHSKDLSLVARLEVLRHLERLKTATPEVIQAEYRRLVAANAKDWRLRREYIGYLERLKKYQAARDVATDWLARNVMTAGLEAVHARTAIARMFYLEGRYEEALEAIKPVIESQQGNALETAALVLEKLGQAEDAEKMARFAVDRYPDNLRTRTDLLEILWRHGKVSEAATVIKASPYPLNYMDWKFVIGKRFNEVFQGRSKDEGLKAFAALREAGFDPLALQQMADEINMARNHELAFHMSSQLRSSGLEDLDLLIRTYAILKAWQGKHKAVEWIRGMIPASSRNPASMVAFGHNQFELLWELIGQPDPQDHPEFVWLLRAAASAKQGSGNDLHRDEFVKYYSTHPQTPYDVIGRYLLGLATEDQVLSLASDSRKRCEIAYYFALRAQGEGKYEDASDWYRVAVETGLINNGEYRWAHSTLYKWYAEGKSLARLAQEKV